MISLSSTERRVLIALATGITREMIAAVFKMKTSTVNTHLKNIRLKLYGDDRRGRGGDVSLVYEGVRMGALAPFIVTGKKGVFHASRTTGTGGGAVAAGGGGTGEAEGDELGGEAG